MNSLVQRDPFFPFHRAFGTHAANPGAHFTPQIDAVENETEFRVTAELPGLEESDFSVAIEDGVLTVSGDKKSRFEEAADNDENGESSTRPGYHRVETRWGHFERRLRFGVDVDEEAVKASYKNGVLEVVVPKAAEVARARTIPVTAV